MTRACIAALAAALVCPAALPAQSGGRPMTVAEFLQLERVADPQLSPDGQWILYTVTTTSLEANARTSDLWMTPTAGDSAACSCIG